MISRVLIADDEPLARERVAHCVAQLAPAATVECVGDGAAAIDAVHRFQPHAVLLDIQMPGRSGFEVIEAIGPEQMPPVVLVTAYDAYALRAFELAAVDYLLKPFNLERFASAWQRIERVHAQGALADEAHRLSALLAAVD
ncbi:MAG: response regulator [Gemmatimonadaceae bacterium]|nr:response regulator [Gemmatimonadaceae bacterium]